MISKLSFGSYFFCLFPLADKEQNTFIDIAIDSII